MPDQEVGLPGLEELNSQVREWVPEPAEDDSVGLPGQAEVLGGVPASEINRGLAQARYQTGGMEETTPAYIARRAIPFFSAGFNIGNAMQYSAAMQRVRSGNATQADYFTVAQHERLNESERNQSTGAAVGSALASLPAVAGEALVGGSLLRGGAQAATAAPSLAARGAAFAGRTLATQATMPTMWNVSQGIEANVQAGQETFDPRGLAPAAALGTIQTAILGSLGPLTNRIAGSGLARGLTRTAAGTGIGMAEQQGADVVSSALADFTGVRGLHTGYGTAGAVWRGIESGDMDDAFKHAMVQAVTFAAFSGLHQAQRPVELRDRFYDATQALARRGLSRPEAGAIIGDVHARFEHAVNSNLSQSETRALFETLPEGPVRRYADALAETRPEIVQRPETIPPAQEPPQLQDIQHLPAQGPFPGAEGPPEGPRPQQAQIPIQPPQTAPAGQPAPAMRPIADPLEAIFREHFPSGEVSRTREGVIRAERDGRWVEMAHDPARNSVRLDFGYLGERVGRGERLERGSLGLFRDLGEMIGKLGKTGVNVEYVAIGGRESAYAKMLKRAGYEQVGGPTGEGGELRTWAPKTEKAVNPDVEALVKKGFPRDMAETMVGMGRPEMPPVQASPLAELPPDAVAALAKSLGLTVKSLKAQEHLPWVKAVVDTMQGRVAPAPQAPAAPPLSLQERMRQRTGPAPEPGPGLQHVQVERTAPVVEPPPQLTRAEQRVLDMRDRDMSFREIGRQLGMSYEQARLLEGRAREKQGKVESIAQERAAEAAAQLAWRREQSKLTTPGELTVVKKTRENLTPEDAAHERMVADFLATKPEEFENAIRILQDSGLTAAEAREHAEEVVRRGIQAQRDDARSPQPVNVEAPVHGGTDRGIPQVAEEPRPATPDQGTQGPAQGNAQAAPAPAGGGPADQGLTRGEVLRRQQSTPKRYAAEAEGEGIPADHVHRAFLDHLAIDQAGVRLQNELYDGIKKAVEEQGTTMQALARMLASGRSDAIRGLDDVVTRLDGPARTLLERMMQEHNLDSAEAAREVLEGGRRDPRRQEELYGNALDELIAMREAQKEIDRANTENRRNGQPEFTQAEIEEARRKAEQDPNYDPWAEDVPAGQRPEGAQGAEGQAAEAGAAEPGEFDFGLSARLPVVPEQRGPTEPGAELPGGAAAGGAGEPRGGAPGAGVAPPRPEAKDPLIDLAARLATEEAGHLDPNVIGDRARSIFESLKQKAVALQDNMNELAGATAPRTTRLSAPVGEALARMIAAPTFAREAAPYYIDKVMGKEATEADRRLHGTTLQEQRHRYAREQHLANAEKYTRQVADVQTAAEADRLRGYQQHDKPTWDGMIDATRARAQEHERKAGAVVSFIGQENSPLKTEADYQRNLASPEYQATMQRFEQHFVPEMEKNYRGAQGLEADDPIHDFTQIPGRPMNAKPVRDLAEATPGTIFIGGRGNLKNLKTRKYGFAEEASLAAKAYDTDLGAIIENSLAKGTEIARRAEFYRQSIDSGVAVAGRPGQRIEGLRELAFAKAPRNTPEAGPNDVMYFHDAMYPEVRKALAVDQPWSKLPLTGLMTKLSLASTVEAAYHSKNLLTFMFKPGVSVVDFFRNAYGVLSKSPETAKRLVELARIGALKESGLETGAQLGGKFNPLHWMGNFLDVMQRTMRLTGENAFDRMARSGRVEGSETNKRDFINQLGQYNRRAQNDIVAFLRDTGIGPFATAGSNYWMQGLRSLTLNPGVKATSLGHAIGLRAEMLAKTLAVVSVAPILNYLLWKRVDGDDKTPIGAIKVGNRADGSTGYLDLTSLTGVTRGAREIGLLATLEGRRYGSPGGQVADAAIRDVVRSLLHPAIGPPVQFAETAYTGENAFGTRIAARAQGGQSQMWNNVAAALKQANPVYSALSGSDRSHPERVTTGERVSKLFGPFGVKYRSTPPGRPQVQRR